jgi:hypothetical protein
MQRAYRDKPLEEAEVAALTGFLQAASEQEAPHLGSGFAPRLIVAGLAGSALLFLLYSLIWGGRLKGSVNRAIYDRQLKST